MPRALRLFTMTKTVKMPIVRLYWVQSKPFGSSSGFSVGGGVAATGASAGAAGAASSAGGSSAIMRSVEIAVLDGRVSGAT